MCLRLHLRFSGGVSRPGSFSSSGYCGKTGSGSVRPLASAGAGGRELLWPSLVSSENKNLTQYKDAVERQMETENRKDVKCWITAKWLQWPSGIYRPQSGKVPGLKTWGRSTIMARLATREAAACMT